MTKKLFRPTLQLLPTTTVCFCLAVSIGAGISRAATVELDVLKDTTIYQNNPNNSGGGNRGLFAGTNSAESARRALISFDLSPIPANATITSVDLRLVIGQIGGSGGDPNSLAGYSHPTIGIHRLYKDWGEGTTGYTQNVGLGGAGQGAPAQAGDATWNARFFDPENPNPDPGDPNLWAEPGTLHCVDRAAIASATLLMSDHVGDVSIWSSTAAMVADVQRWLATPETNFGWILINTNETDAQTFRAFYAKDYDPNPAPPDLEDLFPKLIVSYHTPEPSGAVLLAISAAGLLVLRRFAVRQAKIQSSLAG